MRKQSGLQNNMKRLLTICVFILAAFLRFYHIQSVPPSPSLDEVSIGFNAYSLLQSGRDEYGISYPMVLRAYDDYRPGLYVYFVIPFIKLLGLQAVSVRLPSALLSMLSVYLTFAIGSFIGKKIMKTEWLGIISALLLAISPWHIYISRLGHEANLGFTLLTLAAYFFISYIYENKHWKLYASTISFSISMYGYQSEKIIAPVMLFGLIVIYRNYFLQHKKIVLIGILFFVLLSIPVSMSTVSSEGMMRLKGTSAISGVPKIDAAKIVIKNYVSHFSPVWLFIGRDRQAHKVPGLGLLYPWEGLLILLGFYAMFQKKIPRELRWCLLLWVLSAPLPAAITTQAPHAMRSYTAIPAIVLIEAIGFISLINYKFVRVGFFLIIVYSISLFWDGYFNRFPLEQSDSFQYASRYAMDYVELQKNSYKKIIISNEGNLYQSYMFYLFYTKYDPVQYLREGGTYSGGFAEPHTIGNLVFRKIDSFSEKEILYVVDSIAIPQGARVVATFPNLDGKQAIVAITL